MEKEKEERAGLALSEMLTHSHAGLPGLFLTLLPAWRTTAQPVWLMYPSPPLFSWCGSKDTQYYTVLLVI